MNDLIRLFVLVALLWGLVHYRWLRWGWGRSSVRIELHLGWMYVSVGWVWIALIVIPALYRRHVARADAAWDAAQRRAGRRRRTQRRRA